MVRSRAQIEAEIADAEAQIERRLQSLNELKEALGQAPVLPDEPDKGAVIKFQVQYDPDGPVYSYVAHRFPAEGNNACRWIIGGPRYSSSYYTWANVLDLICEDIAVKVGAKKPSFFLFDGGKTITAS